MIPRRHIDLRLREAWQAGAVDMPDRAPGPTIDRHHCPLCRSPVYTPDDSHAERIDCSHCGAVLVTRRDVAGLITLELVEGEPNRQTINRQTITTAEAEHLAVANLVAELPIVPAGASLGDPNWQARVLAACDDIDKERS